MPLNLLQSILNLPYFRRVLWILGVKLWIGGSKCIPIHMYTATSSAATHHLGTQFQGTESIYYKSKKNPSKGIDSVNMGLTFECFVITLIAINLSLRTLS